MVNQSVTITSKFLFSTSKNFYKSHSQGTLPQHSGFFNLAETLLQMMTIVRTLKRPPALTFGFIPVGD